MIAYLARRLLLMIPTLIGIMLANFIIVQAAPGGPIDVMIARIRGQAGEATARVGGTGAAETGPRSGAPSGRDQSTTRAGRGIDPELIKQLEKQFGFDQPAWKRFLIMMKNYAKLDLGTSFYRDRPVLGRDEADGVSGDGRGHGRSEAARAAASAGSRPSPTWAPRVT